MKKHTLSRCLWQLVILFGLLLQLPLYAAELSVAQYIQIEIDVRQISIAGAAARYEQLSGGRPTRKQARMLSEKTYQNISEIYRQAGISPSTYLVWENRNRKAIRVWLNANPDRAKTYYDLDKELNRLSYLIDSLQQQ